MSEQRYYVVVDPDSDGKFRRVYPDPHRSHTFLWKRLRGGKTTFGRDHAIAAVADARTRFGRDSAKRILVEDDPFSVFEARCDLVKTSSEPATPGAHSPSSYHYQRAPWGGSCARDYGDAANTVRNLLGGFRVLRGGALVGQKVPRFHGAFVAEAFGPVNFHIKNGVLRAGMFPDHEDHLHVAFTG